MTYLKCSESSLDAEKKCKELEQDKIKQQGTIDALTIELTSKTKNVKHLAFEFNNKNKEILNIKNEMEILKKNYNQKEQLENLKSINIKQDAIKKRSSTQLKNLTKTLNQLNGLKSKKKIKQLIHTSS